MYCIPCCCGITRTDDDSALLNTSLQNTIIQYNRKVRQTTRQHHG